MSGLIRMEKILTVPAESTCGSQGQVAIAKGFFQAVENAGVFENKASFQGHPAGILAKVLGFGIDQAEVGKTEIHHGTTD
jgi:hypothetical protein